MAVFPSASCQPHAGSWEKITSLLEIAEIGLQLLKMPEICTLFCDLKQNDMNIDKFDKEICAKNNFYLASQAANMSDDMLY